MLLYNCNHCTLLQYGKFHVKCLQLHPTLQLLHPKIQLQQEVNCNRRINIQLLDGHKVHWIHGLQEAIVSHLLQKSADSTDSLILSACKSQITCTNTVSFTYAATDEPRVCNHAQHVRHCTWTTAKLKQNYIEETLRCRKLAKNSNVTNKCQEARGTIPCRFCTQLIRENLVSPSTNVSVGTVNVHNGTNTDLKK